MQPVIVWGAGGHARVIADIIQKQGIYHVHGFLDDVNRERHGTKFCNSTVIGDRSCLDNLLQQGISKIVVAIGNCDVRLELAEIAQSKGFEAITAIHPNATIGSDVIIGQGSVVMAGAVINPGSRIGNHCIVNTAASVDHECQIADGTHIGPGAHLGGNITIGRATWIGLGASIRDKVTIGNGVMVGIGAVVVADLPDKVMAYGVPAKIIKKLS